MVDVRTWSLTFAREGRLKNSQYDRYGPPYNTYIFADIVVYGLSMSIVGPCTITYCLRPSVRLDKCRQLMFTVLFLHSPVIAGEVLFCRSWFLRCNVLMFLTTATLRVRSSAVEEKPRALYVVENFAKPLKVT